MQRETDRSASLLFLPRDALGLLDLESNADAISGLGVVRGVEIPSPEGIEDVFFASMSGRYVPFDEGSFDRWRPQRQGRATSYEAAFAHELATSELVPVTSSPIRGTSLASFMTHGTAWTVSVAEGLDMTRSAVWRCWWSARSGLRLRRSRVPRGRLPSSGGCVSGSASRQTGYHRRTARQSASRTRSATRRAGQSASGDSYRAMSLNLANGLPTAWIFR